MVSWILIGLGAAVSLLGWSLMPVNWGYGLFGFGLAHVLLGCLDMLRSPERQQAQADNQTNKQDS
ncbi:hypothetical protein J31TS4_01630 [Paenibacillus sp. J31TS4]|uniref:hypothetical protein n=1 Tax=Paenibacillus sp. J31TS4 TaxID=2807195 RepID=UPI001B194C2D|nr:hypothetical protein [Paenibacillus sp. J31TS4]GIP36883.1 hypothetical protein J31TS4_01630 [Paenibacillus sp. J31TS4]